MALKYKLLAGVLAGVVLVTGVFFGIKYLKESRAKKDAEFYQSADPPSTEVSPAQNAGVAQENKIAEEDEGVPGEYLTDEDKEEDQADSENLEEEAQPGEETYIEIKKTDCDEKCEDYKDDEEDLDYCREVCGLEEIAQRDSVSECEDLEGLKEDYCLRDVAIEKLDYSICDKIEDAAVRKMCHNRVTEDLLDKAGQ